LCSAKKCFGREEKKKKRSKGRGADREERSYQLCPKNTGGGLLYRRSRTQRIFPGGEGERLCASKGGAASETMSTIGVPIEGKKRGSKKEERRALIGRGNIGDSLTCEIPYRKKRRKSEWFCGGKREDPRSAEKGKRQARFFFTLKNSREFCHKEKGTHDRKERGRNKGIIPGSLFLGI